MLESLIDKAAGFQVFFCEICYIFKNTIFYRIPPVAFSFEIVVVNSAIKVIEY